MFPTLRIGPVLIPSTATAWIVALWLGAYVTERECNRRKFSVRGDEAWNIVALATVTTVISGRLVYVAQNFAWYAFDGLQTLVPASGTLSVDAGGLLGLIAAYVYVRWRKIPLAHLLDMFAPGVLLAIAIITIGQWLSGEALGATANLPWAIFAGGEWRHPVQLYDALAALVGLIIVWRISRGEPRREGATALIAIAWYSAARLILEAFRAEPTLLPGGYRSTQVCASITLLIALWLIMRPGLRSEGERIL